MKKLESIELNVIAAGLNTYHKDLIDAAFKAYNISKQGGSEENYTAYCLNQVDTLAENHASLFWFGRQKSDIKHDLKDAIAVLMNSTIF